MNQYLDCFSSNTIHNAIRYFSSGNSLYSLYKAFNVVGSNYQKYLRNGDKVWKRSVVIVADIEPLMDKEPFEIAKLLKEKYPNISTRRIQQIIYNFNLTKPSEVCDGEVSRDR